MRFNRFIEHLETQKRRIFGYIWLIGLGLLTGDIWNHNPKVGGSIPSSATDGISTRNLAILRRFMLYF